jgi:hypothetical protein
MRAEEATQFFELLDALWMLKGSQPLTPGARAMFFRSLSDYPLNEVRAGLDAHIRDPKRGQFLPMPADVIAQIQGIVADDGRPGPEEAWAQAFKALDERVTVVWTSEAHEAYSIASPILQAGDEVGARMAFRETYTRLVAEAREARAPVRWVASIGDDNEQRDRVLLPHVQAGRISADQLKRPELLQLGAGAPALGLNALLALPPPDSASPHALAERERARKALAATKAELAARRDAPTPAAVAAQVDRQRVAMLKAESAGKLREFIESMPETLIPSKHMANAGS